jgi:hypothetical protein
MEIPLPVPAVISLRQSSPTSWQTPSVTTHFRYRSQAKSWQVDCHTIFYDFESSIAYPARGGPCRGAALLRCTAAAVFQRVCRRRRPDVGSRPLRALNKIVVSATGFVLRVPQHPKPWGLPKLPNSRPPIHTTPGILIDFPKSGNPGFKSLKKFKNFKIYFIAKCLFQIFENASLPGEKLRSSGKL